MIHKRINFQGNSCGIGEVDDQQIPNLLHICDLASFETRAELR